MRVLVKGAGVAGLTVAFELAARGATVTVAEMRHG
ncbi:MAG: FAD-dependent oxidoreductase, partial [Mesorhizobium sp.]